ncbi:MAG: hypothetical protein GXP62_11945, partial [Oligoflexia bacterium]|nr:hypothetical protein [Oligoflexia bacterium]
MPPARQAPEVHTVIDQRYLDHAYLDHNASAPMSPDVVAAVQHAMLDLPGNPHSTHS